MTDNQTTDNKDTQTEATTCILRSVKDNKSDNKDNLTEATTEQPVKKSLSQMVAEAEAKGDKELTITIQNSEPEEGEEKEFSITYPLSYWKDIAEVQDRIKAQLEHTRKALQDYEDKKEALAHFDEAWGMIVNQTIELTDEALKQKREAEKAKKDADKAKKEAEKAKREAEKAKALNSGEIKKLYKLPTSSASNLIIDGLSSGTDLVLLPERKTQNRNVKYEAQAKGNARRLVLTSKKETITLEIDDINKLDIRGKTEKSLFALSLIKANEQAIHNGELTKESISFPLQELIDLGMYSDMKSARRGFSDGMRTLTSLKVGGKVEDTKKKVTTQEAIAVLFTGAVRKNGICTIYLNPLINWNFVIKYFAPLPCYYFSLPLKASDLLYYICYLARQNTKEIADQGYFTISMKAIQEKLQLPKFEETKNPKQKILEPIENAIDKIMEEGKEDFRIELAYDVQSSTAEILKTGYLKIYPLGEMKEELTSFSQTITQEVEKATKRQEKIEDTAKAKNLQEQLKKEEKNS